MANPTKHTHDPYLHASRDHGPYLRCRTCGKGLLTVWDDGGQEIRVTERELRERQRQAREKREVSQ